LDPKVIGPVADPALPELLDLSELQAASSEVEPIAATAPRPATLFSAVRRERLGVIAESVSGVPAVGPPKSERSGIGASRDEERGGEPRGGGNATMGSNNFQRLSSQPLKAKRCRVLLSRLCFVAVRYGRREPLRVRLERHTPQWGARSRNRRAQRARRWGVGSWGVGRPIAGSVGRWVGGPYSVSAGTMTTEATRSRSTRAPSWGSLASVMTVCAADSGAMSASPTTPHL